MAYPFEPEQKPEKDKQKIAHEFDEARHLESLGIGYQDDFVEWFLPIEDYVLLYTPCNIEGLELQ